MTAIFKDILHDQLGTWPLGYIPYGGADYGEIEAVVRAVGDGDDSTFHEYLASVEAYTMDGRIEDIQCPTLFTLAENDSLASGTQRFFDALCCPKTLIRFGSSEGAGEHCEMRNRSLVNRRVLDWMDEVLG
jgi:hypothetical protein